MTNIQSKIQIAVYQGNTEDIKELLKKESADWYTVTFTVQRARRYSNTKTREALRLVLDSVTLSECQRSYIKEVILWDMGTQVNSILKSYV